MNKIFKDPSYWEKKGFWILLIKVYLGLFQKNYAKFFSQTKPEKFYLYLAKQNLKFYN